jgi:hypothetical protein
MLLRTLRGEFVWVPTARTDCETDAPASIYA